MVNSLRQRGRMGTLLLLLAVSLGAAACDRDPSRPPPDEFPNKLYAISFEAPPLRAERLAGQDEWFAALGPDAARIIARNIRVPKEGSYSLQIDGSRLEALEGYVFGSYARPVYYAPLRSGMPLVAIEGWVGTSGSVAASCGVCMGLTGTLDGEPVPNALICLQEPHDQGSSGGVETDKAYISMLSNYNGEKVYGPAYTVGEWMHLRAVFDFERRKVQGYVNGRSIGEVPFTSGISDEVTFMNISLGSSHPIPGVISYFDGVSVSAGPRGRR